MTNFFQLRQSPSRSLGFGETVALVAALMGVNALAIDVMLPGLPEIGHALGIAQENHRQWIITAYMIGFGLAHLAWGPLADHFGRRPVLLTSLALNLIFSLAVTLAGSFGWMILCRALNGMSAAGARVVGISIVRDCYSGRKMARVMSLAYIVFMAVPVLAPSIGQAILHIAPWRWMFGVISIWTAVVLFWALFRLPETLHPEFKMGFTPARWLNACRKVLGERNSVGYTLAQGLMLGTLFSFVNSSQQIFFDVFKAPAMFIYAFAGIAGTMAVASLANAQIVQKLGMRRVSHAALLCFVIATITHAAFSWAGVETMWSFIAFQAMMMACFGLATANFGAMAMEYMGDVAGTASSIQGFFTTVGGSALGFVIGQLFDGTTGPIVTGYVTLGLLTLLVVLTTEGGRLFKPQHEATGS